MFAHTNNRAAQYRDLPHDTQLSLVIWEMSETAKQELVGSTVMPLFSRKGRLKTGPQHLKVRLVTVLLVQEWVISWVALSCFSGLT